ncbi:MAG TPA: hypothetical protein VFT24_12015 [Vicinamibacterales bacterium]|jgi:hypothetical protein|nr:hypothetical protein [Vicinamibacterales bacterium]
MQVTRDIVIDLLPLYQSGEASKDSRAAIEEFLRKDPSLAQMTGQDTAVVPTTAASELERQTIMRTRATIRRRSWMLAAAIWFTLLPFSFAFRGGRITFFMLRDQPESVLMLLVAIILWFQYARMTRTIGAAGL